MKQILKEYLHQEIYYLKKYLSGSDEEKDMEIVEQFSFLFEDFLLSNDLLDEYSDLLNENRELASANELKEKFPELFESFKLYILEQRQHEIPSSWFFEKPKVVKNQWLIHFTNSDPWRIAKDGFKGVNDFDDLAYTGRVVRKSEGFNFAYLLSDYKTYGKNENRRYHHNEWKYGQNALLFRASGIRVYHKGDLEYQVIFWGPSATDFVPIEYSRENESYCVSSRKTYADIFCADELETVVDWVVRNYDQYRKHISYYKIKKKIHENVRKLMLEYFNQNVGVLKNYLKNKSKKKIEELAENYYYLFSIFYSSKIGKTNLKDISVNDLTEKQPYPKTYFTRQDVENKNQLNEKRFEIFGKDAPEIDTIEFISWLKRKNYSLFKEFGNFLLEKFSSETLPQLDSTRYPSWIFLKLSKPEIVKNQWLVHFTSDPFSIAKNGFIRGVSDYKTLGLTGWIPMNEKNSSGYNFAFLAKDIEKSGKIKDFFAGETYKYGAHAVVFRASGIKTWHVGDREHQVIFDGKTAKNIVPIEKDFPTRLWKIYGKNKKVLFKTEKLKKAVEWVIKNYDQYRKQLDYSR